MIGADRWGALSPGGVVAGAIEKGELDSYTLTAAQGEGVILRAVDLAGGPLWMGFSVYGPAGNLMINASGAEVASWGFSAPSTGTYTVVVYDVSTGLASTGGYKLCYTKAPGTTSGGALSSGSATAGHLDKGELDSYSFAAVAGHPVQLQVTDLAAGPLWMAFAVYGPAGNLLSTTSGATVAARTFTPTITGVYTLVVYDASTGLAATGDYELDYAMAP